jgi:hypothetical protein
LVAAGVGHVQVNAAGDLALRGGWFDSAAGVVKPWSIGVVNPDNRSEIVKVYEITDGNGGDGVWPRFSTMVWTTRTCGVSGFRSNST